MHPAINKSARQHFVQTFPRTTLRAKILDIVQFGGLLPRREGDNAGAATFLSPWSRILEAGGDAIPFQVQSIQLNLAS